MSILVFDFMSTILDNDAFDRKKTDKAQDIVSVNLKIKRSRL